MESTTLNSIENLWHKLKEKRSKAKAGGIGGMDKDILGDANYSDI